MFKFIIASFILTTFYINAFSQTECPCCSEPYNQFNYWEGSWTVYDTSGKKVGTNVIIQLQNGCLLQENWKSSGKHAGTSYNFYNKTDKSWNQIWVDNQGVVLDLKGGLKNGSMTLESAKTKNKKGEVIFHRIMWVKKPDDSVWQIWDVVKENGDVEANLFTGIYIKDEDK